MACLRFGKDALGKEILELVPTAVAAAPAPSKCVAIAGTEPSPSSSSGSGGAESKPYKGKNTIVMMEWEKPYMRRLVDALGITEESDVLEIGFGLGFSFDRIQELSPRSHTVIEPDPVALARLRDRARTRPGVRVVEGFWQTALATLGNFHAVFFDDFPLPGTPDSSDLRGPLSRWHAFIDLCAAHHLYVGARITGYLARPLPLARPGCVASPLVAFPVDVPKNCPYFPYGEAYIPLITRAAAAGFGATGGVAATAGDDDASTALASSLLLQSVKSQGEGCGGGGSSSSRERKRQKRRLLEALVKESLGLNAIGE